MNLIPTYTLGAKLVLTSVNEPWQKVFEVASIKICQDSNSVSYGDRNGNSLTEFFVYEGDKIWKYDPFGQANFYVAVVPYFGSETLLLPEHLVPQLVGVSVRVEIPVSEDQIVSFMATAVSFGINGVTFQFPNTNYGSGDVNCLRYRDGNWMVFHNSEGVNHEWENDAKVYLKS